MAKDETGELTLRTKGLFNMKIIAGLLALVLTGSGGGYLAVKTSVPDKQAVESAVDAANDIRQMRGDLTKISATLDSLLKNVDKDRLEMERRVIELERFRNESERRLAKLEADKK